MIYDTLILTTVTIVLGLLGLSTWNVGLLIHEVGLSVCRTITRRNIEITPSEVLVKPK